ncbi:MAG: type IV pilus twitching motility protein PilT [Acidobacteriota bacterium]|nr:type IV pilus twitching motility protein PilT [Acidobacteriota bacterium]
MEIEQYLARFKEYEATEIRLETGQKPQLVTSSGAFDLSPTPLQHRDIVQMLSPIMPPSAKADLMSKPGTDFTYNGSSGTFNISIRKSSLGFNVSIRSSLSASATPSAPSGATVRPAPQPAPLPQAAPLQASPLNVGAAPPPPMARPAQPQTAATSPQPIPAPVTAQSQATAAASTARAKVGSGAEIDELFYKMVQMGASDLHMSVSMPPMVRHDGEMKPLPGYPVLTEADNERLLKQIMPERNKEEFARRHDTDFAYEIKGLARFRSNIFMDRNGIGAVFRVIPSKILTAEQLNLPKAVTDLCFLSKGLVVVTGPTGSGKSTTLAAMIDYLNRHRKDHVITIEDPIEFVHENKNCLINQREVHTHTDSFKDALRAALREDPDIILVGEMRDLETIAIAIETAETGHLVFGTLHTTTAASTVDRLIDQFPSDRQAQIRTMLSESLKGVIAQTLLKKKGGGRVAALEILLVTPAISNLIREGKTFQIPSVMQTARGIGMVTLNDALIEHVKNGTVAAEEAYVKAVDKSGFKDLCRRHNIELNL